MADPAGREPLSRRVLGWWLLTALGLTAVAWMAGGWRAGLATAVVAGVATVPLWWTWLAEADALDRTLVALARLSDEGGVPPHLEVPGEGGRLARRVAALLADAREASGRAERSALRTVQMLDAAPNGIVVVGPDGRIERTNTAIRDMLDLQKDPVGRTPLEALPAPELHAVIARGVDGPPQEFVRGEHDLEASAYAMTDGLLVIVRDVSRERQVDRARTDFVANVSHELRTPIAAILGFAETLQDTPDLPPLAARMADKVHRNGLRLRSLFEDLLALYKLEARRQQLPREVVHLSPLLAEAVVPAVDQATWKGVDFSLDVPDDLHAEASPQALATIVGNLAGNACKYTPEGGRVTVVATATDEGVRIDVSDTGVGIPPAAQERVFERFYRVDGGRTRDAGGTGLGLAIVKHLAHASGCQVSLTSAEGQGATFSVHLPAAQASTLQRTWDVTLGA